MTETRTDTEKNPLLSNRIDSRTARALVQLSQFQQGRNSDRVFRVASQLLE